MAYQRSILPSSSLLGRSNKAPSKLPYVLLSLLLALIVLLVTTSSFSKSMKTQPHAQPNYPALPKTDSSHSISIQKFSSTFPGDSEITFNIIMTSIGRNTLKTSLESAASQLSSKDYLTLLSDGSHEEVASVFNSVPCNCTKLFIANAEAQGWWGHGSRNRWQSFLPGAFHMNADDDDIYLPGALDTIRKKIRTLEPKMYIFRMIRRVEGMVDLIPPVAITDPSQLMIGTIGTPCAVYRALRGELPKWGTSYGGDGEFFIRMSKIMDVEFVPDVIYQVGQDEDLTPYITRLNTGEHLTLP